MSGVKLTHLTQTIRLTSTHHCLWLPKTERILLFAPPDPFGLTQIRPPFLVTSFSRATRPDFPRGYLGLARALHTLGSTSDAREAVLQGLDRCPEDQALLTLRSAKNTGGGGAGWSQVVWGW